MCGIAGIAAFKGQVTRELLSEMTNCLSHRGPDHEGSYINNTNTIGLGFRRLSILDLSEKGNQPMFDLARNACIVFNGEIYNFRELRTELEGLGRRFASRSDSEVLINAYLQWGVNCLEKLNGMFAFAIWDMNERHIFLARDRFGIKPLYYTEWNGSFAFASELKSLLKIREVSLDIEAQAVWNYLTLLQIPAPQTIYKGVLKLLPAHAMIVRESGKMQTWRYWHPDLEERDRPLNDLREELLFHLERSIKRHLISDVPVGVFLSGGLDSSTIVALASRSSREPLRTFSASFSDDGDLDESAHQQLIVDRFKTNHTEFRVTPDILSASDIVLRQSDEPFAVSSAIPLYYVSKAASEHVKVVLSGDGGDELFGGYEQRYAIASKLRSLGFLPKAMRSLLTEIGNFIPDFATTNQFFRRVRRASDLASLSTDERYLYSFGIFTKSQKVRLLHRGFQEEVRKDFGEHYQSVFDDAPNDTMRRYFYIDMMTALSDEMLTKIDRCTSAVSLEGRVPFLDKELAEFALSIPSKYRFDGGTGKKILRETLEHVLPKEIVWGRKRGFNVPLDRWMKENADAIEHQLLYDSSSEFREIFDAVEIKKIIDVHRNYNPRFGHHLWALLQFERWSAQTREVRNRRNGMKAVA